MLTVRMLGVVSLVLIACGCQTLDEVSGGIADAMAAPDPVTGERTLNLQGEAEEIQSANEATWKVIAEAAAKNVPLDAAVDTALYSKLQDMLTRITAVSHRRNLPWEVHLIPSDTPNAFTIGGGKLFFFLGITELATTDEELAAVMAHEIAHNSCRHITETQSVQLAGSLSSRLSASVSSAYYRASFSTEHENEADRVAMLYLALAGYEPSAMPRIWQRAHERFGSDPGAYTYDHALNSDRAQMTQSLVPIARKYFLGTGVEHPDHDALLIDNELVPRAKATEGFAALIDALAGGLEQHTRTQAEAQRRQAVARKAAMEDPDFVAGAQAQAAGDYRSAIARYEVSLRRSPSNPYTLYNLACIAAVSRRDDVAFEYLSAAVDAGFTDAQHIRNDPDLATLREDPRFKRILRRARGR